jgi:hypothetical protein
MPDVAQKIITGNPQRGGGIVSMAGAKALTAAEKIGAEYRVTVPLQKDQPIAVIEARLDTRLDDVRYYSGDSSS